LAQNLMNLKLINQNNNGTSNYKYTKEYFIQYF
jgi:hypothetical protein